MKKLIEFLANSQSFFINLTRISIFIVMVWIGGLKAFQYEADGIVPFVANSPLMSFFYNKPAPEYNDYKNPEGKTVQKNTNWHKENGTYLFAYGLGTVIVIIGIFTVLDLVFKNWAYRRFTHIWNVISYLDFFNNDARSVCSKSWWRFPYPAIWFPLFIRCRAACN